MQTRCKAPTPRITYHLEPHATHEPAVAVGPLSTAKQTATSENPTQHHQPLLSPYRRKSKIFVRSLKVKSVLDRRHTMTFDFFFFLVRVCGSDRLAFALSSVPSDHVVCSIVYRGVVCYVRVWVDAVWCSERTNLKAKKRRLTYLYERMENVECGENSHF